ncbi:unnamed protein product [Alopecurus aequalis]
MHLLSPAGARSLGFDFLVLHLAMTYPRGLLLPMFLATYTLRIGSAALSFDYNFSTTSLWDHEQLKFMGVSYNDTDRIVLTNDAPNLTGRVAHQQSVHLWDDRTEERASFETTFCFAIGGEKNYSRGDGLAFFIGPFPPTLPLDSHGGYLGLFNNPANDNSSPQTIGVEFDTCWNDWDPKKEDGSNATDHIGIDINKINSSQTTDLPDLSLYGTMWATITYDGNSKMMKVTLRLNSTYELNRTLDLKDDANLTQYAAVGFSAATGPLHQSHHLLSWSFHSTDLSPPNKKLWVILVSVAASVILAGSVATLTTGEPISAVCLVARKFSYSELVAATDDFPPERKIGAGGFSELSRSGGTLTDLRVVAVKKLTGTPEASRKDYETEIKTLGQLSHRNLLKLIGWCNEGDKLLLVYELMPNGSLDDHLHGDGKTMSWLQRYNIVLGIASAIDYLHAHYDAKRYILHRDVKPSNVMLDEDFEAKLGDFGLVRQLCRQPAAGTTGTGTTVIGSLDYIDPTYIETGKLSPASDVYSFGVLLLEVATGRKPSVSRGIEGHRNTLVDAVRRYYDRDAILEMADERLRGEFEQWQMERVMLTGLLCVQMDQHERPSIKDAIDLLSKQEQYPLPQILE